MTDDNYRSDLIRISDLLSVTYMFQLLKGDSTNPQCDDQIVLSNYLLVMGNYEEH